MEFDNIVFVHFFEELNLWHTQNFQKDLTLTKGNRVQMSTSQLTEPVRVVGETEWKKSGIFMFCLSIKIWLSNEKAEWMSGFWQQKERLWKTGDR